MFPSSTILIFTIFHPQTDHNSLRVVHLSRSTVLQASDQICVIWNFASLVERTATSRMIEERGRQTGAEGREEINNFQQGMNFMNKLCANSRSGFQTNNFNFFTRLPSMIKKGEKGRLTMVCVGMDISLWWFHSSPLEYLWLLEE
jgi:hypothetical protein